MRITIRFSLFATGLTILFIILKLFGIFPWSWWWVFSPFLFEMGIAILLLIFLYIVIFTVRWKIKGKPW